MHFLPATSHFLAAFAILAFLPSLPAAPATFKEDGRSFVRMGQTTFRWNGLVKVYDIALHLGKGEAPTAVLGDVPMRLELVYHRAFPAAKIKKGGDALLRRNVSANLLEKLGPRLAELNRAYVDVKAGDAYALTYVPGRGTTLRLNGKPLATVPGHDFAAAYFSIWLGTDPISDDVRDELLGR